MSSSSERLRLTRRDTSRPDKVLLGETTVIQTGVSDRVGDVSLYLLVVHVLHNTSNPSQMCSRCSTLTSFQFYFLEISFKEGSYRIERSLPFAKALADGHVLFPATPPPPPTGHPEAHENTIAARFSYS